LAKGRKRGKYYGKIRREQRGRGGGKMRETP